MYKFFELLELDEYLTCFQLLKSRTKLHQQDLIWKDIVIKKELKEFELKKIKLLKKLRSYKKDIGREWFANLRMDLKSLTDPKARLR